MPANKVTLQQTDVDKADCKLGSKLLTLLGIGRLPVEKKKSPTTVSLKEYSFMRQIEVINCYNCLGVKK